MIQTATPKRTRIDTRFNQMMNDELELMGAYVAGVIDATGSVSVQVRTEKGNRVGYSIVPSIQITKTDPGVLYVIDNWAQEHGVFAKFRDPDDRTTLTITKREDVETFLRAIKPFVIVKSDPIEIIIHEVLPRLRDGTATTKEGFLETMDYVDMVRKHTMHNSRTKYDREYFEEEWSAEI